VRRPASRTRRTSLATALSAVILLAGLAACSDDGGEETPEDLGARMDTARTSLDEAASLQVRLATDALPDGVQGLVEADGVGNHDPAFEGTVTVASGALGEVDAEVVSVDGDVYAELPFTPGFSPVDPGQLGAPDPAALLATDGGVSGWLTSAEDLGSEGESRDGGDVLTAISGTLPGAVVAELIPSADDAADFTVEFRLTDDDVLRDASITGPFYPDGGDVTYELVVEPSDESVDITAP